MRHSAQATSDPRDGRTGVGRLPTRLRRPRLPRAAAAARATEASPAGAGLPRPRAQWACSRLADLVVGVQAVRMRPGRPARSVDIERSERTDAGESWRQVLERVDRARPATSADPCARQAPQQSRECERGHQSAQGSYDHRVGHAETVMHRTDLRSISVNGPASEHGRLTRVGPRAAGCRRAPDVLRDQVDRTAELHAQPTEAPGALAGDAAVFGAADNQPRDPQAAGAPAAQPSAAAQDGQRPAACSRIP